MHVEMRAIDSIQPYDQNPRVNDTAVEAVAKSIEAFGFRQPIVVDEQGVIIVGHTRWKAAKQLGMAEVPVHVAVGLNPEQARAYRIADNQTATIAEWDDAKLIEELKALQEANFDLDLTGFDDNQLSQYLYSDPVAGEVDPDDIPALPDAATTQVGDIWLLGDHRLMCGDSSKPEDVDRLLAGATIQLVNTDPPYNVKVEPRSNNAIAAGLSSFAGTKHHQKFDVERHPEKAKPTQKKLRAKDRPLANDFVSDEEFDRLLQAWFGNMARVLEAGRSLYIWGGYANCANYPPVLKANGLYFSQAIIWVKEHPVLTRKDFMGNHEWCFYCWKEGKGHEFFGPNNATDVWAVKKINPQNMVHLCLHPETTVLTEAGFRPIRTIQAGQRVFAGDGRFQRVSHVSTHPYQSTHLIRLTAKGGNATTEASDNHPFLIWRPRRRGARFVGSDVAWVRADEIQVGDYTMTPMLLESGVDPYPDMDEETWFLFGLFLAQGHFQQSGHGGRRYPAFNLHKKRQDLVARIVKRWPGAREYDPNDYETVPSSGLKVIAFDAKAGELFERLGGRRAEGKHLAPELWALPRAKRCALLHGWLNGDGCRVHDRTYWQGNTVSADLAAQLSLLAESVGFRTTMYGYDPPAELGGIGERPFKSRQRYYNLYFYERTQEAKRGSPRWVEHEGRGYSLRYVKRVERVPYVGEVWNLSVEGHPSFQTAVGLSHNTEKPVELAVRAMQYSSRAGENVLDLFGGSGSTLIAAEQLGRKAFLMELDPLYCDTIVLRFAQFVGDQTKVRLQTQQGELSYETVQKMRANPAV